MKHIPFKTFVISILLIVAIAFVMVPNLHLVFIAAHAVTQSVKDATQMLSSSTQEISPEAFARNLKGPSHLGKLLYREKNQVVLYDLSSKKFFRTLLGPSALALECLFSEPNSHVLSIVKAKPPLPGYETRFDFDLETAVLKEIVDPDAYGFDETIQYNGTERIVTKRRVVLLPEEFKLRRLSQSRVTGTLGHHYWFERVPGSGQFGFPSESELKCRYPNGQTKTLFKIRGGGDLYWIT